MYVTLYMLRVTNVNVFGGTTYRVYSYRRLVGKKCILINWDCHMHLHVYL